ncbi:MAG: archaeoflavoprotein AfpA [Candidatus Methanoperedens sp.]|nr:archaeoflavoprotein AfpA [Candidatus Methanoperedens sp.]MCZ7360614.1 archaeoflavoprotein AfpA [Candidatus Methanoperedens sp.]HLB71967.1 archaeoflavoprotein AfpA [Candidatus Methanoperedens sp.]
MTLKIAWGITGCGDHLKESLEIMKELTKEYDLEVKVFLSQAGEMVVKWYKLFNELRTTFPGTYSEKSPNLPFLVGDLQLGKYDFLLIMPSTSNTVGKIASGISDTLLTNAAAQAMKARVPVYIFPADQIRGEITTDLPGGKKLTLTMRDVDIDAVDKLRRMQGITVLEDPAEIGGIVKKHIESKKLD